MGRTGTPGPRSLADDLRARSDAELVDLLRIRPDLVTPIPVDIAQLASRATTRASVVHALDRLDRFTLRVVDALAVLPEPTSPEAVRMLLGIGMQDVTDALDRLHSMALVWGSRTALRLGRRAHEAVGAYPPGLSRPADRTGRGRPPPGRRGQRTNARRPAARPRAARPPRRRHGRPPPRDRPAR